MKKSSGLEWLDLSNTRVQFLYLNRLSDALVNNKNLRVLNLSGCHPKNNHDFGNYFKVFTQNIQSNSTLIELDLTNMNHPIFCGKKTSDLVHSRLKIIKDKIESNQLHFYSPCLMLLLAMNDSNFSLKEIFPKEVILHIAKMTLISQAHPETVRKHIQSKTKDKSFYHRIFSACKSQKAPQDQLSTLMDVLFIGGLLAGGLFIGSALLKRSISYWMTCATNVASETSHHSPSICP